MSRRLPTPDAYFKYWHHAFEVRANALGELRSALDPACRFGDLEPLRTFARPFGASGETDLRWFTDAATLEDGSSSPAALVRLCQAPGAITFGARGCGELLPWPAGTPLLPPPEEGRFYRWLELGLDGAFEGWFAPARELLKANTSPLRNPQA